MEKQKSDEIDLYDLFVKTILFLKANIVLLVICAVVGVLGSVGYARFSPAASTSYTGKILVYSKVVNITVCSALIANLNTHITSGEVDSLATDLNLSQEQARGIGQFRTEGIRNEKVLSLDSIYSVVVELRDKRSMPDVRSGLLHFIQSNPFVKREAALREATEKIGQPKSGIEVISTSVIARFPKLHSLTVQVVFGFIGGLCAAFFLIIARAVFRIAKSSN